MEGWIKIHRKILENPIVCKDSETLSIWIYILLNATHKEIPALFKGKKITLQKGQLITGILSISKRLKINKDKIQRTLKCFETDKQIEQQTSNQNRLITIVNWNEYQEIDNQNDKQMINKRETNDKQLITNKNVKNERNILYYGEYKNVFFTNEQYQKLLNEFPNDYNERIQRLDDYIQSSGKKYKDCLATIRTWARKEGYIKPSEQKEEHYVENTMSVEEYFAKLKGVKSV
jgi:paraquat-inducible protein B